MTLPYNLNRFGGGHRRPYYCEVEYLESTGTQYIKTGFFPDQDTKVECYFDYDPAQIPSSGTKVLLGSRIATYNNQFDIFLRTGAGNVRFGYGADLWEGSSLSAGPHLIVKDKQNNYVDGVLVNSNTAQTFTCVNELYIFGENTNGTFGFDSYTGTLIHYCKVYDDGVLVRDYIPVLDWNMEPCLYDKITNTLAKNAGTGTFSYGRQIHYVDYLESTNTQYIDTGVIPTIKTKTAEKSRILTGGGKVTAFARWSGNPTYDTIGTYLAGSNLAVYYGRYSDNKVKSNTYTVGTDFEIVNDVDKIIFNGNVAVVTRKDVGWTDTAYTLCLFAGNNVGNVSFFSDIRMYYYKVWEDGVPVRDYLPAVDENGVGFMFDGVYHKIYDNAGSGAFKYPDVPLEYLESSGTEYIQLNNTFNDTDECGGSFAMLENVADKYFIAPSSWSGECRFALGGSHISNFSEFQPVFTCAFGTTTTGYTHYLPQTLVDYNEHRYSYKNRVFRIEDLDISFDATALTFNGPTTNLRLFYGYNTPTKCRVYSYWQKRSGDYLCNLVPVLNQSLGGCLYDSVSETYFTNAGTGTFKYRIKEKK